MIHLFFSHAPQDAALREELAKHLAPLGRSLDLRGWHSGVVSPGADVAVARAQALQGAGLVLILVSPDYLAEEACQEELLAALRRHDSSDALIVPIIVRPCDWRTGPLEGLQPLPRSGNAISTFSDRDTGWLEVVAGIRELVMSARSAAQRVTLDGLEARNRYFVGRADLLAELWRGFAEDRERGLLAIRAIVGLGGVGKTQAALEYAHRHRTDYEHVFFIPAGSETTLQNGIAGAARALRLPVPVNDPSVAGQTLVQWLRQHGNWLLMFDDVEHLQDLHPWVATATRGHILITSRLRDLQSLGISSPSVLTELPPAESVEFLLCRTGRTSLSDPESEAAHDLARELGGLPLALEHAGAYLLATEASFSAYLTAYRMQRLALLDRKRPGSDNGSERVSATWEINFRRIEEEAPVSLLILHQSAFLHPDSIPLELFRLPDDAAPQIEEALGACGADEPDMLEGLRAFIAAAPLILDEMLERLTRYSLIRRDLQTDSFQVHSLVQEAIRAGLQDEVTRWHVTLLLEKILKLFPFPVEHGDASRCARLVPHVLRLSRFVAGLKIETGPIGMLFNQAAVYLIGQHQYRLAEPLLRTAAEMARRLAPDSSLAARINLNLSTCCGATSREAEARTLLEEAAAAISERQGRDSGETALALNNLALTYPDSDERHEALLLESLGIRRRIFGIDHPEVAQSLNNLSVLHARRGDLAKAEALALEALAIREKHLGQNHPLTARCCLLLGDVYERRGELERAVRWFQRGSDMLERGLGAEHPELAVYLGQLADPLAQIGRTTEAITAMERAVAIQITRLDAGAEAMHRNLRLLARIYQDAGLLEEGRVSMRTSLARREQVAGVHDRTVGEILYHLGLLEKGRGDREGASRAFRRSLRIIERCAGPNHVDVAEPLNELALLAMEDGDLSAAEHMHRRAIEVLERAIGPETTRLLQHLNNLATVRMCQGELDEALVLHRRSLSIREARFGADSVDTATCLGNMGIVYEAMGQLADAERCHRRALDIRSARLPEDHPDVAKGMHLLGRTLLLEGQRKRAKVLLDRAREIVRRNAGSDSERFYFYVLGEAYVQLIAGDLKTAEALVQELIPTLKTASAHDAEQVRALREQIREMKAGTRRQAGPHPGKRRGASSRRRS